MVKAITSSVQLPATFMLPLSQMQIKLRSQSDLGQASLWFSHASACLDVLVPHDVCALLMWSA